MSPMPRSGQRDAVGTMAVVEKAVDTVLKQAELLAAEWAA